MIILTGANRDKPTNDYGDVRHNIEFTFSSVIKRTVEKAQALGYKADVYDLGELGMGTPFSVGDESFEKYGYYEKEVVKGYKSKSLFKPKLVKKCLYENEDLVAYLDGDALLCGDLSEVQTDDYDVGVTLRDKTELEAEWHKEHFDIAKFVNAGVIFFRPTEGAKKFIDRWDVETDEIGNDQMALNKLACPDYFPEIGSVLELDGVRIKYFAGVKFNYYYFRDLYPSDVRIMHFKGDVRHLYPYNFKTKLVTITRMLARNLLIALGIKKR